MSEQFIPIGTASTMLNLQHEALRDAGISTGDPRSFGTKVQARLSDTILDDSPFKTMSNAYHLTSMVKPLRRRKPCGQQINH